MILGQTKDVGFQLGARKTFHVSKEVAWNFLFSNNGLKIWLGEITDELKVGETYKTKEGIEIFIRVFHPLSHIRLDWKKKEWNNMSRVQVRVFGNRSKTTISFHQEKLLDRGQREEMREYWNKVINKISNRIYE